MPGLLLPIGLISRSGCPPDINILSTPKRFDHRLVFIAIVDRPAEAATRLIPFTTNPAATLSPPRGKLRDFLLEQKMSHNVKPAMESNQTPQSRAEAIKAEYLASACQAVDVDEAVVKLMAECSDLFADDRAAWSFLMDEAREEMEGAIPQDSWLRGVTVGSEVWWNDPDHGISSGYYTVDSINGDNVEDEDTVLNLKNSAGSSAEVFASELAATQPEDLYAVVEKAEGTFQRVGYASSKDEAVEVGNATMADEVVDATLEVDVVFADGSTLPKAWFAQTSEQANAFSVRLTLDVTYNLNGEIAC